MRTTIDVEVALEADVLPLWFYVDRLAEIPSVSEDHTARFVFPSEASLTAPEIRSVQVAGRDVTPTWVRHAVGEVQGRDVAGGTLMVPLPEGHGPRVRVEVQHALVLPDRFGRIGHIDNGEVDDLRTLAAPWYPLVLGPDPDVPDVQAFAFEVGHDVSFCARGQHVLLGGALAAGCARTRERSAYVPALAAPALYVTEMRLDGVPHRLVSSRRLYQHPASSRSGLSALSDLSREDVPAAVANTVRRAAQTVADHVPLATNALSAPLTIVQIPSRTELFAEAPSWVLMSDRAFQVTNINDVRRFHERGLERALFRHWMSDLTRTLEPVSDRAWATDLRAVVLLDLHEVRLRGGASTPEELLGFAAFHPAVDQLLYAPQIAFAEAYFGAIDDGEPFRDNPSRARFPWATGRRVLEGLRDMEADVLEKTAEALFALERPASAIVSDVIEDRGGLPRLRLLLRAPAGKLNLRLGRVRSRPDGHGSFVHDIEVVRRGDPPVVPVQIKVLDDQGAVTTLEWDEGIDAPREGARTTLTVTTRAALANVYVDPSGRVPQTPALADGHPRADDAVAWPYKPPLLRNLLLTLSPHDGGLSGFIDFAMRRRYDLDETYVGLLHHNDASTGGAVRYVRGVGPKRHNNSRFGFVAAGLGFSRLHAGFAGAASLGAHRWGLTISGGFDTRRYFFDPREGVSLGGSANVGLVREDGNDTPQVTGRVGLRGSVTQSVGLWHTFLFVASGGYSVGRLLPAEQQSLGGRYELRGYEASELLGRGTLMAVVEHRFTPLTDLNVSLFKLAYVRELQWATFAGAGLLHKPIEGGDYRLAAEVGAGLRVHFDYAGIQPAVFSLDVALPLLRDPNDVGSDGILGADRIPVGVHLSFDQYY